MLNKSMLFNVTGYLNLKCKRKKKTPKIQLYRFTLNIRIKQLTTNCSYSIEFSSLKGLEELATYLVKTEFQESFPHAFEVQSLGKSSPISGEIEP